MARRGSPSPTEYDLSAILADPRKRPGTASSRRLRIMLAVGAALLLPLGARWAQRGRDQRDNLAPVLRLSSELADLQNVDGDWIGVAEPTWPGATSPPLAAQECPAIALRAGLVAGEVLSIMSAGGTPLASCEPGGER